MLGNAFNNLGRTNLVAGKADKGDSSSKRHHLVNQINRLLNDYFGVLIILVALIVLFLSYQFVLQPKYQKILSEIKTNTTATKQLAPKYQELAKYEGMAAAYAALDPQVLEKHSGLVPKEYIKEDLFAEVLYLLSRNGYDVKALDVSREGDETATSTNDRKTKETTDANAKKNTLPSGVGTMRVAVSLAEVDYPSLKKLLTVIQSNLRLTDVQQLVYDPKSRAVALSMTTYYLKK